jgi:hypothetical protein
MNMKTMSSFHLHASPNVDSSGATMTASVTTRKMYNSRRLCAVSVLVFAAISTNGCSHHRTSGEKKVAKVSAITSAPTSSVTGNASAKQMPAKQLNLQIKPKDAQPNAANHPPSSRPQSAILEAEKGICNADKIIPKSSDPRIYATWQSIRIALGKGLGVGTLRVLEDSRLTKTGTQRTGTNPLIPPCYLLESRVEILDAKGVILHTKTFLPELDVVVHTMGKDARLIEIIERFQCLASCWCGDNHSFWQMSQGQLVPHKSRIVKQTPTGAKPSLGTVIEIRPVVHGCYERSHFNHQMLVVERASMGTSAHAVEKSWFENGEWKTSIANFK